MKIIWFICLSKNFILAFKIDSSTIKDHQDYKL